MKEKLHHIVYITSMEGSDKFYIGKHSTNNLNDGYKGSGRWIEGCKRNGAKLKTEIVWEFSSEEKAFEYEEFLVSKMRKDHPDRCMNFLNGGKGGTAGVIISEETKKKMSISKSGVSTSLAHKMKMSEVGLTSERHKEARLRNSRLKKKWIVCMNSGTVHHGLAECSEFWGLSISYIHELLNGKKKSKKYKFEYLDGEANV